MQRIHFNVDHYCLKLVYTVLAVLSYEILLVIHRTVFNFGIVYQFGISDNTIYILYPKSFYIIFRLS